MIFGLLVAIVWVIAISCIFVECIKELADRFSFSKTFIGFSALAIATSFPEFVNAIVAGIYDRSAESGKAPYSLDSFYNLTGANMLQNVFLSAVTLGFGIYLCVKKQDKKEFLKFNSYILYNKYLLWGLIVTESILLLMFLYFRNAFKALEVRGFNFCSLIFVAIWIIYFSISFKQAPQEVDDVPSSNKKNYFKTWSNKQLLAFGACIWVMFAGLSCINFYLITEISKQLNIPDNVALGFLLGLITSIPEFSSFFFLFREKNYEIATAGLFGSSLFNLCLPFLTNLISGRWLFSSMNDADSTKLMLWLLTDVIVGVFLYLSAHKSSWRQALTFSGMAFSTYLFSVIGLAFL